MYKFWRFCGTGSSNVHALLLWYLIIGVEKVWGGGLLCQKGTLIINTGLRVSVLGSEVEYITHCAYACVHGTRKFIVRVESYVY